MGQYGTAGRGSGGQVSGVGVNWQHTEGGGYARAAGARF